MRLILRVVLVYFVQRVCFAFALALASLPFVMPAQVSAASVSAQLQLFPTEEAAQKHCPRDVVVWLNTKSGIYHEKGMRWYGRTKQGAYVCKREADGAGDRDTRNGQ